MNQSVVRISHSSAMWNLCFGAGLMTHLVLIISTFHVLFVWKILTEYLVPRTEKSETLTLWLFVETDIFTKEDSLLLIILSINYGWYRISKFICSTFKWECLIGPNWHDSCEFYDWFSLSGKPNQSHYCTSEFTKDDIFFTNVSNSFENCLNLKNSHRRCSIKKLFSKISQNSQENTCVWVSFLIKM